MHYGYDPIEQHHTRAGHPENAGRLAHTIRRLDEIGLRSRSNRVRSELASDSLLEIVHPSEYIAEVGRVCGNGGGQLDPDTYAGPESDRAARAAVGIVSALVDRVVETSESAPAADRRAFALVRPPGHHALADRAMGFCIYGTVAIAARAALRRPGIDRVLIVDWDVHHGNGTEAILAEDPAVAFFSTHQFPFYPGTGSVEYTGEGSGSGATLNVPLPPGVGDIGYGRIFEELLEPWASRFDPDLVLVSAGYDAHWRDPLAQESLSLEGFAKLQRIVTGIADRHCDGRLVLALEGGYDTEVLPFAISNAWRLLDDPSAEIEDPFGSSPDVETSVSESIARVREIHGL